MTDMKPFMKRQDANQKLLKHLDSVVAVPDAPEGEGGVVAEVLDHHLLPPWVFPQEGGDVIDPVVDDHPPVVTAAVLRNLFQTDQW